MELVFIGDRCCDHSPSSGYDQLCSLFPDAGWLSGRKFPEGQMEWLRDPSQGALRGPQIFHVIYGDCSGKALPEIVRQRFPEAKIVSSIHQPVSRLKADRQACSALAASDAIVTVSETQARELAGLRLAAPIHAIPHGVWTRAFHPEFDSPGQHYRNDVLLVGSFLRDWDGAKEVVEALARDGVHSIAIGAGTREHLAGGEDHVEVLSRVSEAELVEMYRASAVLFLPFLAATASNALLEAMSAGCPVVCPRLPSLVEYLGDELDCFDEGRYDLACARILHYVRNPSARHAKGRDLRMRASQFDWAHLKQRYEAIYREVTGES
jgi:glycosyltransferase involved in cell wall biosynthesis